MDRMGGPPTAILFPQHGVGVCELCRLQKGASAFVTLPGCAAVHPPLCTDVCLSLISLPLLRPLLHARARA